MQRRHFLNHLGFGAAAIGAGAGVGTLWAAGGATSAKHINIGCSIPLTGPLGEAGQGHVQGVKVAFDTVNRAGGLYGRELRLIVQDDAYDTKLTVANVKQMTDNNEVLAFIALSGTPNLLAAQPLIERAGVPLVGPLSTSTSLRRPDWRNVFHIRPSTAEEVMRMVEQMDQMGLQNIAFVYLDNGFGKDVMKDAERVIGERKLRSAGAFALAVDGKNAAEIAHKVLDVKAGAVFVGAIGSGATDFVIAMRRLATGLPIVGMSATFSDVSRLGAGMAAGLAMAQVFPNYKLMKSPLVRSFQAAMAASNQTARRNSPLESWVSAQALIEGLKRAGKDITHDKLRSALAGMRNYDVGELRLGFSAQAPYVGSLPVRMGVMDSTLTVRV
jgi:branched-chain amino acid transport system substrate-binding protein